MATMTRLTADDLLAMPDEGRGFELVNGELRELSMSMESGHVGASILSIIRAYAYPRKLGVLLPQEVGFKCFEDPDLVKRPDVAFIEQRRITREQYLARGYCPIRPDLVVEVVSPSEDNATIHDKREEWLAAGVPIFWIADPRDETIRVYRAGEKPQLFTSLDAIAVEPFLPGFTCLVSEFFAPPPGLV